MSRASLATTVRTALRHRVARVALVLGVIATLALVPLRAPARAPNILVIVVDTLRADRLGAYGNPDGLTPFLDELARRGTVFVNAYAPSSWTCPSVASIMTSRYASQHHVATFDAKLGDQEVTLAEVLAQQGYVGGGFSANFRLADSHGFAQGFRHWRTYVSRQKSETKVRGERLLREATTWLQSTRAATQAPLLLYLQYMEPHTPYHPIEPYRGRHLRPADGVDETVAMQKLLSMLPGRKRLTAEEIGVLSSLYDGEVASGDAEIRRMFGELERSGFLDDAIIVITSDHGEEFGEHDRMLHGFTLYNSAIRVPLIIVAPGVAGGRVVQDNVSLIDIAPTILDLVKAPPAPTFEGRSLVPLMTGATPPLPRSGVLSELEPMDPERDLRAHSRALMSGTRKLLVKPNGNAWAFELTKDPAERRPRIVGKRPNAYNRDLVNALEEMRQQLTKSAAAETLRQPLDEATREKLRALGYQN